MYVYIQVQIQVQVQVLKIHKIQKQNMTKSGRRGRLRAHTLGN